MLLPKRIELLPDESVSSFIQRLANENGHSSTGYLTQRIGITVSKANNNEFSEENLRILSLISGVRVNKLIDHNADKYKKVIGEMNYSKYILKNRVKFCPVCIKENLYHKYLWYFNPLHLCTVHHTSLVEHCPRCGSFILMRSLKMGRCHMLPLKHNARKLSELPVRELTNIMSVSR